jgi:gas vesicle protein
LRYLCGVYWKIAKADGFAADLKANVQEINMDKNGLSAFLLGLGVGVGIGMLFAPKSGAETREIIKNKAGEGTDFIKQRGTDMKQTASEWVDKGKEALGRQKETLSDAMEAGKRAYQETVGGEVSGG